MLRLRGRFLLRLQAEDARAYNEIVTGWSAIEAAAARQSIPEPQQSIGYDAPAPLGIDAPAYAIAGETDLFGVPREKDLFGDVVEEKKKKR